MSHVILYGYANDGKKYPIRCSTNGELVIDDSANPLGSYGNLQNGSLEPGFSAPVTINNLYRNCILSYVDQSVTATKPITVWGSTTTDTCTYIYLGSLTPTEIRTGLRFGSLNINLGSIKYIKIFNEETIALGSVVATLLSA
jgi:hypothetical protein